MTKKKQHRGQTLSRQILGLLAVTLLISVVLMQILSYSARGIIENILFLQDILLTETQYADLNDWIFNLSLLVSVIFFILLFLFLLGERLSYINDILKGIDALQQGNQEHTVPIEGHNELTQLATSVNYLSATQKQIKEKEQALAEEKEQLTRSLSHDIRTPLTSILSYTELLAEQVGLSPFHFIRTFKKETGFTPHEYLVRTRIDMAKYLLKNTGMPVKDICFATGFSSESVFCSAFKKSVGMSPKAYKRSQ